MTEQEQTAATVTFPSDHEVRIERWFDAPRDLVVRLMLDPELIGEWWGPYDVTTVVDVMDVRPGGRWRFVVSHEGGPETAFRGEYRELDLPERIVQTFEWEGMPGHVSVETARFEEIDGRTRMTTVADYGTPEDRDGTLSAGMERGMNEMYRRFDALLARSG